jgi:hypothetical protein
MNIKLSLKRAMFLVVGFLLAKHLYKYKGLEGFNRGHGGGGGCRRGYRGGGHYRYNVRRKSPYYGGYWGSDNYYYPRHVEIVSDVPFYKDENEMDSEDYPMFYYPYYYVKRWFS